MTNPYEPPEESDSLLPSSITTDGRNVLAELPNRNGREPAILPSGTTMPRHMAAIIDNILAAVLSVIVAKQLPDDWLVLQSVSALIAYLSYYQIFEMLLSATPGKLAMGLRIVTYDGNRCSAKQVLIRTLFRLLEVNPFLLGAVPAAARIVMTKDKQRFGDKVADTLVVFR
ncbi:MAG: RDD family protein [Planctomycetales bacterium]|nr:RDD family protein [Planctomycetales bacterium]